MDAALRRFPQRRAFVTGAGSGLGRAICRRLAERGWTLGVQDIHEAGARETLEMVERLGGRGEVYVFDVADTEAFLGAAREFVIAHGGIDLAVNNAGVAVGGRIGEIPLEDWSWILGINLKGVIHGCHAFIPIMRQQGAGHVVNIASMAGLIAAPNMGAYNATKFAVVGLSETLRGELAGSGVSVSVVCPSFFRTNIHTSSRSSMADAEQVQQFIESLMNRSSLNAEDIAEVILEAVAQDSFYVIPHRDGRVMWLLKRLSPRLFNAVVAAAFQRSLSKQLARQTAA